MFDAIAIGAANTDFFFHVNKLPSLDEEVDAFAIDKQLGGSAANFAVGCGKLNLKTAFLGCLGKDKEGNELLASFQETGIDTSLIKRVNTRTGRFVTIVDRQGKKVMVTFVGSNNSLSREMIEEKNITSTKLIHLTSLSSEKAFNALLKAKKVALKSNILLSLDPGHILAERKLEGLRELIEDIDLFFPNKSELKKITGKESVKDGCRLLQDIVKTTVVTIGNKGCFVSSNKSQFFVPTIAKKVVDSTGAGDAFATGFVYGFLKDWPLKDCAVSANTAAGLSVQGKGARTLQISEKTLLGKINKK